MRHVSCHSFYWLGRMINGETFPLRLINIFDHIYPFPAQIQGKYERYVAHLSLKKSTDDPRLDMLYTKDVSSFCFLFRSDERLDDEKKRLDGFDGYDFASTRRFSSLLSLYIGVCAHLDY